MGESSESTSRQGWGCPVATDSSATETSHSDNTCVGSLPSSSQLVTNERSYSLPYFAPQDTLPEPLPTDAAIRTSKAVLQDYDGRRVVRVGQHFVVKWGVNVRLTEGTNMLFVRDTSAITVPQVFALYTRIKPSGHEVGYIVMEYIPGEPLETLWKTASDAEKSGLRQQLRVVFDSLRSIPSPGYIGCVGRRPLEEGLFWTLDTRDGPDADAVWCQGNGPFDTEEQFNDAFVEKYHKSTGLSFKARFYRRIFSTVLRDHPFVFTHGDFQPKNVIVKTDGGVVLIDWELAAWYPSYWEYAIAMACKSDWKDDWHDSIPDILNEYPHEYAWFEIMKREIWC